jgi:DNA-binding protein HU-beta
MNKADLVARVAKDCALTKKASVDAIESMIAAISKTLSKGEKVQLIGFGTFAVRKRQARDGRNPRTGKKIKIAAKRVPIFKAGRTLRNAVLKK